MQVPGSSPSPPHHPLKQLWLRGSKEPGLLGGASPISGRRSAQPIGDSGDAGLQGGPFRCFRCSRGAPLVLLGGQRWGPWLLPLWFHSENDCA